jgi:quinol monooxygenase YgiN
LTKSEVRFTVSLAINAGQFDAFDRIALAMTAGTRKESGSLGYDWCLNGDRSQCRLVETYKNGDAALIHLTGPVVTELVPKLLEVSAVRGFEVYGDPGPKVTEILSGFGAKIFPVWRGLE